jgi:hypothetical protein
MLKVSHPRRGFFWWPVGSILGPVLFFALSQGYLSSIILPANLLPHGCLLQLVTLTGVFVWDVYKATWSIYKV